MHEESGITWHDGEGLLTRYAGAASDWVGSFAGADGRRHSGPEDSGGNPAWDDAADGQEGSAQAWSQHQGRPAGGIAKFELQSGMEAFASGCLADA